MALNRPASPFPRLAPLFALAARNRARTLLDNRPLAFGLGILNMFCSGLAGWHLTPDADPVLGARVVLGQCAGLATILLVAMGAHLQPLMDFSRRAGMDRKATTLFACTELAGLPAVQAWCAGTLLSGAIITGGPAVFRLLSVVILLTGLVSFFVVVVAFLVLAQRRGVTALRLSCGALVALFLVIAGPAAFGLPDAIRAVPIAGWTSSALFATLSGDVLVGLGWMAASVTVAALSALIAWVRR